MSSITKWILTLMMENVVVVEITLMEHMRMRHVFNQQLQRLREDLLRECQLIVWLLQVRHIQLEVGLQALSDSPLRQQDSQLLRPDNRLQRLRDNLYQAQQNQQQQQLQLGNLLLEQDNQLLHQQLQCASLLSLQQLRQQSLLRQLSPLQVQLQLLVSPPLPARHLDNQLQPLQYASLPPQHPARPEEQPSANPPEEQQEGDTNPIYSLQVV